MGNYPMNTIIYLPYRQAYIPVPSGVIPMAALLRLPLLLRNLLVCLFFVLFLLLFLPLRLCLPSPALPVLSKVNRYLLQVPLLLPSLLSFFLLLSSPPYPPSPSPLPLPSYWVVQGKTYLHVCLSLFLSSFPYLPCKIGVTCVNTENKNKIITFFKIKNLLNLNLIKN